MGFRWRHAGTAYDAMLCRGLDMDQSVQNTLVAAFDNGSRWGHALAQLQEAQRIRLADATTASKAISACAGASTWERAILTLLSEPGTWQRREVYSMALMACYRACAWEHCLHLYCDMQANFMLPGTADYACLLRACGCSRQPRVFRRVRRRRKLSTAAAGDAGDAGDADLAWSAENWACEAAGIQASLPSLDLGAVGLCEAYPFSFVSRYTPKVEIAD